MLAFAAHALVQQQLHAYMGLLVVSKPQLSCSSGVMASWNEFCSLLYTLPYTQPLPDTQPITHYK